VLAPASGLRPTVVPRQAGAGEEDAAGAATGCRHGAGGGGGSQVAGADNAATTATSAAAAVCRQHAERRARARLRVPHRGGRRRSRRQRLPRADRGGLRSVGVPGTAGCARGRCRRRQRCGVTVWGEAAAGGRSRRGSSVLVRRERGGMGPRMVDTAAWLCDAVIPEVPVRQWVLSLPYRVRTLCAYDTEA
ncbi:MAG: hypothetical protein ACK58T_07265, partial [Phycisphaerae bacterium]